MATTTLRIFHVGLDDQGHSDHAVETGVQLTRIFKGKLELTHVVPFPEIHRLGQKTKEFRREEVRLMTRSVDAIRRHLEGLESSLELSKGALTDNLAVQSGPPGKVLASRAMQSQADVLLLGPNAKSGKDLGSTAETILQAVSCGVWVQPTPFQELRSILVPLDLSDGSLSALASATALASQTGATISVLHCTKAQSLAQAFGDLSQGFFKSHADATVEELHRMLESYPWNGVEHDVHVADEKPVQGILERQVTADLTILGTNGLTGIARALKGSVSHSVLAKSTKPVWIVPAMEF